MMTTEQLVADLALVKLLLTLAILLLLGGVMLAARVWTLTRSLDRKTSLLQDCLMQALQVPREDADSDACRRLGS